MKTHIINTYSFSELSETAKKYAWEHGPDFSDDYSDEFRATLEAFENIFDIKVYKWDVDGWRYSFDFVTAGTATECPEGDALRVARYIWNNYADAITKGKFYSTRGTYDENGRYHYKYRHSNISVEMDNCPLTGVCWDCDILAPVIACLHYKRFFTTFEDLITDCLNGFFSAWNSHIEYASSFEYFEEIAEANDFEFYENGRRYA